MGADGPLLTDPAPLGPRHRSPRRRRHRPRWPRRSPATASSACSSTPCPNPPAPPRYGAWRQRRPRTRGAGVGRMHRAPRSPRRQQRRSRPGGRRHRPTDGGRHRRPMGDRPRWTPRCTRTQLLNQGSVELAGPIRWRIGSTTRPRFRISPPPPRRRDSRRWDTPATWRSYESCCTAMHQRSNSRATGDVRVARSSPERSSPQASLTVNVAGIEYRHRCDTCRFRSWSPCRAPGTSAACHTFHLSTSRLPRGTRQSVRAMISFMISLVPA